MAIRSLSRWERRHSKAQVKGSTLGRRRNNPSHVTELYQCIQGLRRAQNLV